MYLVSGMGFCGPIYDGNENIITKKGGLFMCFQPHSAAPSTATTLHYPPELLAFT